MAADKWKIPLVDQVGSIVEFLKSLATLIHDLCGDTQPMDRLNKDPALRDDIAQITMGRSIALPIEEFSVTRKLDDKEFVCLSAGKHIVAVASGRNHHEKATEAWLRIGDHIISHGATGDIKMMIWDITTSDDTGEIYISGVDNENRLISATYDTVSLYKDHPERQLQTALTHGIDETPDVHGKDS